MDRRSNFVKDVEILDTGFFRHFAFGALPCGFVLIALSLGQFPIAVAKNEEDVGSGRVIAHDNPASRHDALGRDVRINIDDRFRGYVRTSRRHLGCVYDKNGFGGGRAHGIQATGQDNITQALSRYARQHVRRRLVEEYHETST